MANCRYCGLRNAIRYHRCIHCGTPLSTSGPTIPHSSESSSAIHTDVDLPGELNLLNKNGYSVYLMSQDADISLKKIDHFDKTVFVFGNESDGLSEALLKEGFDKVKIEGFSDCESLNVAVSCGIVLNHYRNIQSG